MHSMRLRWNVEAFERISVRRASARALGRDSIFSLSDGYIHPIGFTFFFSCPEEERKTTKIFLFLSSFLSFVVSWMFFTHKTIPSSSSSSSSSSPSCHNSKT